MAQQDPSGPMILVRITGGTLYTGPISQEADMTAAATLPAGIGDKVLVIIERRWFFFHPSQLEWCWHYFFLSKRYVWTIIIAKTGQITRTKLYCTLSKSQFAANDEIPHKMSQISNSLLSPTNWLVARAIIGMGNQWTALQNSETILHPYWVKCHKICLKLHIVYYQ